MYFEDTNKFDVVKNVLFFYNINFSLFINNKYYLNYNKIQYFFKKFNFLK